AAEVELWGRGDGAVAVDAHLTGQAHLVLVAQARQHGEWVEVQVGLLHQPLGTEVLHTLLDEHLAGAAHAQAAAIDVARHALIQGDTGAEGCLAEVGAVLDVDFLLFRNKDNLGHGNTILSGRRPNKRSASPPSRKSWAL